YEIKEISPRPEWVGKTLREAEIRRVCGVTILGVYRNEKLNVTVMPDFVIAKNDVLIALQPKKESPKN
ncbi:MAG: TrkA C-terminal domain-containing protein, partial [Clostridiales bacterium]|nr:TrkA C-terminal domain-containing protein [Clostridiales bacterium]